MRQPAEVAASTSTDGLVDVSLTIADAFRLEGDFRILAAAGAVRAGCLCERLAHPGRGGKPAQRRRPPAGSGSIPMADRLHRLQADLNIPQVDLRAGVEVYLGVNTTATASTHRVPEPEPRRPAAPGPLAGLCSTSADWSTSPDLG